jgi:hypothetical protein
MRHFHLLLPLLLPCLLLGAPTAEDLLKGLPKTVADCQRGEVQPIAGQLKGFSVEYTRPGVVCHIQVSDPSNPSRGDAGTDEAARLAMVSTRTGISILTKIGDYSDLEERKDPLDLGAADKLYQYRFRATRGKGPEAGSRVTSSYYVFGAYSHVIRVRVTGKAGDEAAIDKTAEQMLPVLMDTLREKSVEK